MTTIALLVLMLADSTYVTTKDVRQAIEADKQAVQQLRDQQIFIQGRIDANERLLQFIESKESRESRKDSVRNESKAKGR